jgi:hypothetical protein
MTFMSGHDNADTATFGSDGPLATLPPPDLAASVATLLTPYDIVPHEVSSMVASNTDHGSTVGVPVNSTSNSGAMVPSLEDKAHTLMLPQ